MQLSSLLCWLWWFLTSVIYMLLCWCIETLNGVYLFLLNFLIDLKWNLDRLLLIYWNFIILDKSSYGGLSLIRSVVITLNGVEILWELISTWVIHKARLTSMASVLDAELKLLTNAHNMSWLKRHAIVQTLESNWGITSIEN